MSRASSIWIVFNPNGVVEAAFTVRHEMITWLGTLGDLTGWRVFRHNDGAYGHHYGTPSRPTEQLDIEDLLT